MLIRPQVAATSAAGTEDACSYVHRPQRRILFPYTPLADPLGFTPLPLLYFLFLIGMVITYLLLVELVKRHLMKRYA